MARTPIDWEKEWKEIQQASRKLAKRANQRLVRLERASKRRGMESILKYAYKSAVADIKTLGKTEGKPRYKETVKLVDVFDDKGQLLKGPALYKANVMIQRTKVAMMKQFLSSASSTIGQGLEYAAEGINKTIGIKRIWNKSTKTINEKYLDKYDLRMSDNDMKRFFESKKQQKLEKLVGSSRMFIVAAYMKKANLASNKRSLEKFVKEHIDLDKYDLDPDDIKAKKGESYKEYMDRLDEYVRYTDDEVLDDMIKKALKNGISVNNIFKENTKK